MKMKREARMKSKRKRSDIGATLDRSETENPPPPKPPYQPLTWSCGISDALFVTFVVDPGSMWESSGTTFNIFEYSGTPMMCSGEAPRPIYKSFPLHLLENSAEVLERVFACCLIRKMSTLTV